MRTLLIEDNPKLVRTLAAELRTAGMVLDTVADGLHADALLQVERYDVVILDLGLPSLDGIEVLRRIRARGDDVPVLILTASGEVPDRVRGLNAGADDYLPKPFSPAELVARVKVLLRRAAPPTAAPPLVHGDLIVDMARHEVRQAGRPVALSSVELRLLVALLQADGRVLTRDRLLDAVYGSGGEGEVLDRTIDVHIGRLRDKLGDRAEAPRYIATVRGAGYRAAPAPTAPRSSDGA